MTTRQHRSKSIAALLLALCPLLLSVNCGGGGGGSGASVPTASFTGSGAAAAPNFVRLRSGSTTGDQIVIDVMLGGPTTSDDIYAFSFAIVLSDPAVAEYVSQSAVAGDVLQPPPGQDLEVLVTQSDNLVVVGVSKLGFTPGNGSPANEGTVVRLTFRVLRNGASTMTLAGSVSPTTPTGVPVALDSTLHVISGIAFDAAPATIRGS